MDNQFAGLTILESHIELQWLTIWGSRDVTLTSAGASAPLTSKVNLAQISTQVRDGPKLFYSGEALSFISLHISLSQARSPSPFAFRGPVSAVLSHFTGVPRPLPRYFVVLMAGGVVGAHG